MSSISDQEQLQRLRPGDRLNYRGVQWKVKKCSTYDDSSGYNTTEWLLHSSEGAKYYLLREVDPQNPQTCVNWYLAEEIPSPNIYQPDSPLNPVIDLWQDMYEQKAPYPEVRVFDRRYYFESRTQGIFERDNKKTVRITWDYWDAAHQWNLALEAWPNGELRVYSTKVVKPAEFSHIVSGKGHTLDWMRSLRVALATAGLLLLLVGYAMVIYG